MNLLPLHFKREKNTQTHRHIEQYFHHVNWLGSDWPDLYGVYTLHVYTVSQRRKRTINRQHWFVILRAWLNWLLISDLHVHEYRTYNIGGREIGLSYDNL